MKPVIPTAKRASSFTIDSLIGNQTNTSSSSNLQADDSISRRHSFQSVDTGSRVPPTHPEFLSPLNRFYQDQATNYHALSLRSWGFYPPSLGTGAAMGQGQYSPIGPVSMNPLLLGRARESVQVYPWLMARQGHCFNYPFPGYTDGGLLFHPYRKPKRIRTAFSPNQLIKLDHAFDNNHYVVGQERKELASKLGLTETQVKVWFQNRRTKYKRVKAEQEPNSPSHKSSQLEMFHREDSETHSSEDENDTIDVS